MCSVKSKCQKILAIYHTFSPIIWYEYYQYFCRAGWHLKSREWCFGKMYLTLWTAKIHENGKCLFRFFCMGKWRVIYCKGWQQFKLIRGWEPVIVHNIILGLCRNPRGLSSLVGEKVLQTGKNTTVWNCISTFIVGPWDYEYPSYVFGWEFLIHKTGE